MNDRNRTVYKFGDFELDAENNLLYYRGESVKLANKTCEVLAVLVDRAGEVVSKDDLLEQVWKGSFVEEGILTVHISYLRRALGKDKNNSRFIETISKKGYRFTGEVERINAKTAETQLALENGSNAFIAKEETADPNQIEKVFEKSPPLLEQIKDRPVILSAALSIFLILMAVFFFGYKDFRQIVNPSGEIQISRLVGTDRSRRAAISPDGKLVAHVAVDANQQQSVWLKQVETNNNAMLIGPEKSVYSGITFSNDGNYIYFVRKGAADAINTLYRISVLGGDITKIWEAVDSPISFSPDGQRFAFVRTLRKETSSLKTTESDTAVIVAETMTLQETTIARRGPSDYFSGNGVSWSPNGKILIGATGGWLPGSFMSLVEIDVENGAEKMLSENKWHNIGQIGWLSDGSGLILTGDQKPQSDQIWYVSYPDGVKRKITNDLNSYSGISLSSNSKKLITTLTEEKYDLWLSTNNDLSNLRQIAGSENHIFQRVAWSPDGRIVFPSSASGFREIWIMNADGTNQKQLTFNKGSNILPSISPDGKYIVFTSNRDGQGHNVWRINIDGSDPVQLTKGEQDFGPRSSSDGRWVLYISVNAKKETIWKVPIEGGEANQIIEKPSAGPDVSPDGSLIACWYQQTPESPRVIALVSREGGEPVKTFEPVQELSHPLRWTSDGRNLVYVATQNGISNLWMQPIDGSPPKRITDFKSDMIMGFDWSSKDDLICARGHTGRSVALISEFSSKLE